MDNEWEFNKYARSLRNLKNNLKYISPLNKRNIIFSQEEYKPISILKNEAYQWLTYDFWVINVTSWLFQDFQKKNKFCTCTCAHMQILYTMNKQWLCAQYFLVFRFCLLITVHSLIIWNSKTLKNCNKGIISSPVHRYSQKAHPTCIIPV
jgi:hypothetical protein